MSNRVRTRACALALCSCLWACDEKASVVDHSALSFLARQERPLFYSDIIPRLGSTPFGKGPLGFGLYRGYTLRDSNTFVEFWTYPFPDPPPDVRAGEPIPEEILLVLEIKAGQTPQIIWPKDLVGRNPQPILKATWREIYK